MSNPTIRVYDLRPGDQYTSPQRDRILTVKHVEKPDPDTYTAAYIIHHEEIRGVTKLLPWVEVTLYD